MANRWNIPEWLEIKIRERDTACVYCQTKFTSAQVSRKTAASWEHIINDASLITLENIALCCCGCNASKGQKLLLDWLATDYCKKHGINVTSVSPVIQAAIASSKRQPKAAKT